MFQRYNDSRCKNEQQWRIRNNSGGHAWQFVASVFFHARDNGKTTVRRRIHDDRLRTISRDGACVVRILKTRKMSRVEIPEILRGDKSTRVAGDNSLVASTSLTRSDITKRLAIFNDGRRRRGHQLIVPFNQTRVRWTGATIESRYARLFGVPKSRAITLSYHALWRAFAGYKFLQGYNVDVIREILDYDDRTQTNEYINNCLYEIERI